jgi:hypothetical protein
MGITLRLTVCVWVAAAIWALNSAEKPKTRVIRVDGGNIALQSALKVSRLLPAGSKRKLLLRGGQYLLDEPLVLTPQDSGLTIESNAGERAELNGGRRITGWRKESDGPVWVTNLPDFHLKPWRFRMLTVNGKVAARTRLPEKGFFTDENSDWNINGRMATDEELTTLRYRPGDLGPWLDLKSAEVRVYRVWDESLSKVAWLDQAQRTLRLSAPLRFPSGAFGVHKYEVLNVRQGLTAPGQWFLDYGENKVYYWPRPGEDMKKSEAWAPLTEVLIQIEGVNGNPVQDVTLRNLDLTMTDSPARSSGFAGAGYDGAISAHNSEGLLIQGLRIRRVGASGIQAVGTYRARILDCEFGETGACAISMSSSNDLEIADCRIEYGGHSTPAAAGMQLLGDHMHVHHNEVHDMPYTGISVNAGEGPVVEFNRVFRVMLKMADGAAFYTSGKNGVVRDNWAYDVGMGPQTQAPAYYLDDGTSGYIVEHNAAAVANWLLHVHNANANTIRENVFATSADGRVTFQGSKGAVLERNVFFAAGKLRFEASGEAIATMRGNIIHSEHQNLELLRLGMNSQLITFDTTGNNEGDPEFVDVTHRNLQFLPSSPALRLRIPQPPRIADVGPRRKTPAH